MTKNNENNATKHLAIFICSSVIDMQKIHVNCDIKGGDGKHSNRFGTNGSMACELRHICSWKTKGGKYKLSKILFEYYGINL